MSSGVLDLVVSDLASSGLTLEDVTARVLGDSERAVLSAPSGIDGYAIPYYDIHGKLLTFYRARLFEFTPKYLQPKETPNHVYFPKGFQKALVGKPFLIVTEGEKKAALACKLGFPCVAFGGVDSWRNRIITLPSQAAYTQRGSALQARLPPGAGAQEDYDSPIAIGLQSLIDQILSMNLHVVIIFDSDQETGVKHDVQRAAAAFGFELRFRGIPFNKIRQLVLPRIKDPDYTSEKVGLDDFLVHRPKEEFLTLLQHTLAKRSAFPRHPNVRDFINKRLQKPKLSRRELQNVSLAILSDLDANGIRLRAPTDNTYYFDLESKKLLKSAFSVNGHDQQFDAPFTQFLYNRYGISGADNRLLIWLGTQFTSENPVERVSPHRVFARTKTEDDSVIYQLSDSMYARVDADGLTVHNNGEQGILFESDQVEPLNTETLVKEFESQRNKPTTNWWADTLSSVRLRDKDKQRYAAALLYYMSPWLHRWRGMQLPVELIIGESGSGKSTLMELRLAILTGRPHLRNAPQDLKDWHASVSSTGGLHVTDNVQLVDKNLRQRLSDEICRIVTEPDPCIEQRRYYTNADLIRIPVRAVFAITAIQQPFQNADILQRAMFLELDKPTDPSNPTTYDSEWKTQQLKRFGGREAWIAHHLVVLHKFFQAVKATWNPRYEARHRLINFEQSMFLMAKVFGLPTAWIVNYLTQTTDRIMSESDWTLEGIQAYCQHLNGTNSEFGSGDISQWCQGQEEYMQCEMLINSRRLARYLKSHKALVANMSGMIESRNVNNRQTYKVQRAPKTARP